MVSTDREDKRQAPGIPRVCRTCSEAPNTLEGKLLESMWWFLLFLQRSDPMENVDRLAFPMDTCKSMVTDNKN